MSNRQPFYGTGPRNQRALHVWHFAFEQRHRVLAPFFLVLQYRPIAVLSVHQGYRHLVAWLRVSLLYHPHRPRLSYDHVLVMASAVVLVLIRANSASSVRHSHVHFSEAENMSGNVSGVVAVVHHLHMSDVSDRESESVSEIFLPDEVETVIVTRRVYMTFDGDVCFVLVDHRPRLCVIDSSHVCHDRRDACGDACVSFVCVLFRRPGLRHLPPSSTASA